MGILHKNHVGNRMVWQKNGIQGGHKPGKVREFEKLSVKIQGKLRENEKICDMIANKKTFR